MASGSLNHEVELNDLELKDASKSTSKGSAHHDDTLVELHEPYEQPGTGHSVQNKLFIG